LLRPQKLSFEHPFSDPAGVWQDKFLARAQVPVAFFSYIPMHLMKATFLRHTPTALLAGATLIFAACANEGPGPGPGHIQGHMVNALQYLNAANNDLSQASHDKGGHRVNAMQLINQAINEVNAGIAVGESHGD
jgi:hypothetical protein